MYYRAGVHACVANMHMPILQKYLHYIKPSCILMTAILKNNVVSI